MNIEDVKREIIVSPTHARVEELVEWMIKEGLIDECMREHVKSLLRELVSDVPELDEFEKAVKEKWRGDMGGLVRIAREVKSKYYGEVRESIEEDVMAREKEEPRKISTLTALRVEYLLKWMLEKGFIGEDDVEGLKAKLLELLADMNRFQVEKFVRRIRKEWSGDIGELADIAEDVKRS